MHKVLRKVGGTTGEMTTGSLTSACCDAKTKDMFPPGLEPETFCGQKNDFVKLC